MGVSVIKGSTDHAQLPDTRRFIETLARIAAACSQGSGSLSHGHQAACDMFKWDQACVVSRAPGRMDVMGGIADYSGALVLQMPISEACHVALQRQQRNGPPSVRVVSFHGDSERPSRGFEAPLAALFPARGQPIEYEAARAYFTADGATSWAGYVVGCLVVLSREEGLSSDSVGGDSLAIIVSSEVPEGKGVSSSAAVEVATMMALAEAFSIKMEGRRLAILCQKVENLVVGAPCGIMDQMASALGEQGRLLALLCQPAEVQGCVEIPSHVRFWGIDSGVRHSVGGSDYGCVRVGAFMGLRMVSEMESKAKGLLDDGSSAPAAGGGYLANLSATEFLSVFQRDLPESISGRDFKARYGTHSDTVTSIDEERMYAVRAPTSHPVLESFRIRTFRQLLSSLRPTPVDEQLGALGELMFFTHQSYSDCGLGSPGTDRLVALVREEMASARAEGRAPTVWGAKITGGGSGGTVCILGSPDGGAAVGRIAAKYVSETGAPVKVFEGSSPGAVSFGTLSVLFSND